MRGAALFLATFLLVVPSAREPVMIFWDQTMGRIAAEYPASYITLVIAACAWILSGLMMTMWPRTKKARQMAIRCFHGSAEPGPR